MENTKSRMMKNVKLGLIALSLATGLSGLNAQTIVFKEVFTGSSKGGKITTKGFPRTEYSTNMSTDYSNASGSVLVKGALAVRPGKPENKDEAVGNLGYVMGEATKFAAPYQTTLSKNTGTVTWYTSMVYNRTARLKSAFAANGQAMVTILACDKADPTDLNAKGYGLFMMGAGKNNRLFLIHFTKGINGLKTGDDNNTIIAQGPNIPLETGSYIMAKVTYQPKTNTWELETADVKDGFKDPLKTGYTKKCGGQVHDGTTQVEMPYFGFSSCFSKTSGFSRFDNFYVTVD